MRSGVPPFGLSVAVFVQHRYNWGTRFTFTLPVGEEAGAADYMVKPFSVTELAARVRAALRRRADPSLSPDLFELSANAGRVLTHDELLDRVWGMDRGGGMSAVRSSVKRLRGKLGDDASSPKYIFAVPRIG